MWKAYWNYFLMLCYHQQEMALNKSISLTVNTEKNKPPLNIRGSYPFTREVISNIRKKILSTQERMPSAIFK